MACRKHIYTLTVTGVLFVSYCLQTQWRRTLNAGLYEIRNYSKNVHTQNKLRYGNNRGVNL